MTDPRLLTHALDVPGRPVVTLGGEDIAQVRDVLFDRDGRVGGFTLAGRGMLAGPMRSWLPWTAVHGFGPDAVVVAAEESLEDPSTAAAVDGGVIGDEVMTRSGTVIGEVTDAVLRLDGAVLDVVGYEVHTPDADTPRFVPLPTTLAVSSGRLVVPDEAMQFLSDDLAGFGASVDSFRSHLDSGAR